MQVPNYDHYFVKILSISFVTLCGSLHYNELCSSYVPLRFHGYISISMKSLNVYKKFTLRLLTFITHLQRGKVGQSNCMTTRYIHGSSTLYPRSIDLWLSRYFTQHNNEKGRTLVNFTSLNHSHLGFAGQQVRKIFDESGSEESLVPCIFSAIRPVDGSGRESPRYHSLCNM